MLFASFSVGDAFLTVLEIALMVMWIWLAISVIFDVFRSSDLSNGAKALWAIALILIPFIGVLIYLIVRGHHMHEHAIEDRRTADRFTQYVQHDRTAESISLLAEMHEKGVLSDTEFEAAKAKALQS